MLLLSDMLKIVILCCLSAAKAAEFQITNSLGGVVWTGIQANSGKPQLENGGFVLEAGQTESLHGIPKVFNFCKSYVSSCSRNIIRFDRNRNVRLPRSIQAPDDWAGRFWARTYCDPNTNHCLTGDCGNKLECNGAGGAPPVSLAEITLKGAGGKDYYDISLVDGYNVPISIEPVNGQGDGSSKSCGKAACLAQLNTNCPNDLKLTDPSAGTVGCKSACEAFNTDQYCCRNAYGSPETCKPTTYSEYFKSACPDAYSYAYDDSSSTFTCVASTYKIGFNQ